MSQASLRGLQEVNAVGHSQAAARQDRVPAALARFAAGLSEVSEEWEARVKVLEDFKVCESGCSPSVVGRKAPAGVSCAGLRNATQP